MIKGGLREPPFFYTKIIEIKMFRQGIVTFFDEGLAQGFIELKTDHQRIVFTLEDFSNTAVLPQIGERVKCVVVEQDGAQFAKFIVRLDHRNAVDGKPSQQVSNGDSLSENARNARKILKKRRIQDEESKDQPTGIASENQSEILTESQSEHKYEISASNIAELTKAVGKAVSGLTKQGLTKIDVDGKTSQNTTNIQTLSTETLQPAENLPNTENLEPTQHLKKDEKVGRPSESVLTTKLKNATNPKKKNGKNKTAEPTLQNPSIAPLEQSKVERPAPAGIIPASTVAPAIVRSRIENALVNLLIPNEQKQAVPNTSQNHAQKSPSEEIECLQENPSLVSSVDLTQSEIESKSQDPHVKAQLFTQAAKVKVKQQNDVQDDISAQQQSEHSYRVVKSVSNIQTVNMQIFEHNKVYQAGDEAASNLESQPSVPKISMAQSEVLSENTIASKPVEDLQDEVLVTEIPSLEIVPSTDFDHKNEAQVQLETPNESLNTDVVDLDSSVLVEQGVQQITLQQNEFFEPSAQLEADVGTELEPDVFKDEIFSQETINQEIINQEAINPETVNPETVNQEAVTPEISNNEILNKALNQDAPKSYKLPEHITQHEEIVLKNAERVSQRLSEPNEVEAINLANIEEPRKHASDLEPFEPNFSATNPHVLLDHVLAHSVEDQTVAVRDEELPVQNKLLRDKLFNETSQLQTDLTISTPDNNISEINLKHQDTVITEVPVLDFTSEINASHSVPTDNTQVNSYAQNQLDRQLIEQRMHQSTWQKMVQNLKIKFLYSKHKKQPKPILAKTSFSFNPVIFVMFALFLLSVSVVIYAIDSYRHYKSESALKLQQYEKEQKERIKEQKREAQRR